MGADPLILETAARWRGIHSRGRKQLARAHFGLPWGPVRGEAAADGGQYATMRLIVNTQERTLCLTVHPTQKVAAIKRALDEACGVAPERQRIILQGKRLQDGRRLCDYMPSQSAGGVFVGRQGLTVEMTEVPSMVDVRRARRASRSRARATDLAIGRPSLPPTLTAEAVVGTGPFHSPPRPLSGGARPVRGMPASPITMPAASAAPAWGATAHSLPHYSDQGRSRAGSLSGRRAARPASAPYAGADAGGRAAAQRVGPADTAGRAGVGEWGLAPYLEGYAMASVVYRAQSVPVAYSNVPTAGGPPGSSRRAKRLRRLSASRPSSSRRSSNSGADAREGAASRGRAPQEVPGRAGAPATQAAAVGQRAPAPRGARKQSPPRSAAAPEPSWMPADLQPPQSHGIKGVRPEIEALLPSMSPQEAALIYVRYLANHTRPPVEQLRQDYLHRNGQRPRTAGSRTEYRPDAPSDGDAGKYGPGSPVTYPGENGGEFGYDAPRAPPLSGDMGRVEGVYGKPQPRRQPPGRPGLHDRPRSAAAAPGSRNAKPLTLGEMHDTHESPMGDHQDLSLEVLKPRRRRRARPRPRSSPSRRSPERGGAPDTSLRTRRRAGSARSRPSRSRSRSPGTPPTHRTAPHDVGADVLMMGDQGSYFDSADEHNTPRPRELDSDEAREPETTLAPRSPSPTAATPRSAGQPAVDTPERGSSEPDVGVGDAGASQEPAGTDLDQNLSDALAQLSAHDVEAEVGVEADVPQHSARTDSGGSPGGDQGGGDSPEVAGAQRTGGDATALEVEAAPTTRTDNDAGGDDDDSVTAEPAEADVKEAPRARRPKGKRRRRKAGARGSPTPLGRQPRSASRRSASSFRETPSRSRSAPRSRRAPREASRSTPREPDEAHKPLRKTGSGRSSSPPRHGKAVKAKRPGSLRRMASHGSVKSTASRSSVASQASFGDSAPETARSSTRRKARTKSKAKAGASQAGRVAELSVAGSASSSDISPVPSAFLDVSLTQSQMDALAVGGEGDDEAVAADSTPDPRGPPSDDAETSTAATPHAATGGRRSSLQFFELDVGHEIDLSADQRPEEGTHSPQDEGQVGVTADGVVEAAEPAELERTAQPSLAVGDALKYLTGWKFGSRHCLFELLLWADDGSETVSVDGSNVVKLPSNVAVDVTCFNQRQLVVKAREEAAAAAKIQSIVRSRRDRLRVDSMRKDRADAAAAAAAVEGTAEQVEAATALQALARGRRARRRVDALRNGQAERDDDEYSEYSWSSYASTEDPHEAALPVRPVKAPPPNAKQRRSYQHAVLHITLRVLRSDDVHRPLPPLSAVLRCVVYGDVALPPPPGGGAQMPVGVVPSQVVIMSRLLSALYVDPPLRAPVEAARPTTKKLCVDVAHAVADARVKKGGRQLMCEAGRTSKGELILVTLLKERDVPGTELNRSVPPTFLFQGHNYTAHRHVSVRMSYEEVMRSHNPYVRQAAEKLVWPPVCLRQRTDI